MAEPEEGVKRVLQIKLRALGDAGQILAFIRSAAPFYRTQGGTGSLGQNGSPPARIAVVSSSPWVMRSAGMRRGLVTARSSGVRPL